MTGKSDPTSVGKVKQERNWTIEERIKHVGTTLKVGLPVQAEQSTC